MKRGARIAVVLLALSAACEGNFSLSITSDGASLFVTSGGGSTVSDATVASDPATDGDVRQDGAVSTGSAVQAGVDPFAPAPSLEHRGFLSFPLDRIPPGAVVESATVTIFVDRVDQAPGAPGVFLDIDALRFGPVLTAQAFGMAGTPVGSVASGIRVFPAAGPQVFTFAVVPELQADVDDPNVGFFQLRIVASGGFAAIVDGAGHRAGGAPADPSLAPVLSLRFRS